MPHLHRTPRPHTRKKYIFQSQSGMYIENFAIFILICYNKLLLDTYFASDEIKTIRLRPLRWTAQFDICFHILFTSFIPCQVLPAMLSNSILSILLNN